MWLCVFVCLCVHFPFYQQLSGHSAWCTQSFPQLSHCFFRRVKEEVGWLRNVYILKICVWIHMHAVCYSFLFFFLSSSLVSSHATHCWSQNDSSREQTHKHAQQVIASNPRGLILKASSGSWQLSLHYLLKLTLRVKQRDRAAACESECVFMHVCCQSHVSHTHSLCWQVS